jgi:hypothetical protein
MIRNTLHLKHLEPFKEWLQDQGIAYRPGKGAFQVLQVCVPDHGYQVVFLRLDMPEHYTVNQKLLPIVQEFIRSRK